MRCAADSAQALALEPKNAEVYLVKALLLGAQDLLAQAQIAYSQSAALDKGMACYTGEPPCLLSAWSAVTIVAVQGRWRPVCCRTSSRTRDWPPKKPSPPCRGLLPRAYCLDEWSAGPRRAQLMYCPTLATPSLLMLCQAIKAFSKALKLNPHSRKAAFHLAAALAGQERHEEVVVR